MFEVTGALMPTFGTITLKSVFIGMIFSPSGFMSGSKMVGAEGGNTGAGFVCWITFVFILS